MSMQVGRLLPQGSVPATLRYAYSIPQRSNCVLFALREDMRRRRGRRGRSRVISMLMIHSQLSWPNEKRNSLQLGVSGTLVLDVVYHKAFSPLQTPPPPATKTQLMSPTTIATALTRVHTTPVSQASLRTSAFGRDTDKWQLTE